MYFDTAREVTVKEMIRLGRHYEGALAVAIVALHLLTAVESVDPQKPGVHVSTQHLRADSSFAKENDKVRTWDDLDNRTLPSWYDEAKFGIFIHWGVFSVPALCSEWFGSYWRDHWGPCPYIDDIMNKTELPNFAYQEFASRFKAEFYNATEWSRIFSLSGAQYVVLTSKHHEGFCMWNSSNIPTTWQWNVMDVGPRRDLLGELASALKASLSPHTGRKLKFGVYHSLYEWFNPLYNQDRKNNFKTDYFVTLKTMPELYDLVEKYEPEIIWSDGEWEATSDYWKAREFLQWYADKIETGVWNDRWGTDTECKHGGFLTCDDRYSPGHIVHKKWENAMTIDESSWGWNRASPYEKYLSAKQLIHKLIETVAYNGNLLLNVGPSADGTINPIFVDRLMAIGEWLRVNGAAIYKTRPWNLCQHEDSAGIFYTRTADFLFLHMTKWPANNTLFVACPKASENTVVTFLGYNGTAYPSLLWSRRSHDGEEGMNIYIPPLTPDIIPCQYSWVLRLTHVDNLDSSRVDEF